MKCTGAYETEPTKLVNFDVPLRYDLTIEGQSSHGPLFPGTSDGIQTVLMFSGYSDPSYRPYLDGIAADTLIEKTKTDLVISQNELPSIFDSTRYLIIPLVIHIRKNGGLISIEGTTAGAKLASYCWRE